MTRRGSIAGNEEADQLAKEAAQEASSFTDERKTTSICDIKAASQTYTVSLWQRRWETTDALQIFFRDDSVIYVKLYSTSIFSFFLTILEKCFIYFNIYILIGSILGKQ